MITKKLILAAVAATSLSFSSNLAAQELRIEIGDRPYYTHGSRYWYNDYEMVWVPGHRSHHRWIHGHYVRGEHRRHDWERRHHDERYDHDR